MQKMYSADSIRNRVKEMARQLNASYGSAECVHLIVIMNGAFMLAADLVRYLNMPLVLHFVGGSYFEGAIKHEISLQPNTMPTDFKNAPVILLEDIVDTGKSLMELQALLATRHVGSMKVVTLLKRQSTSYSADIYGFTIPDNMFVVGYGLDLDGKYRELEDLYLLASAPSMGGVC